MFDKLKDFLKSQADDLIDIEPKEFNKLWREKAKYINDILIAYQSSLGQFLTPSDISYNPKELATYFKKRAISLKEDEELQIIIFNHFLFLKHKPFLSPGGRQTNPLIIIDSLQYLLIYYQFLAESMPLDVTLRIDFSMVHIVGIAMRHLVYINEKEKHKDQYMKGFNKIKANKYIKIQYVYDIYYRNEKIKKGKDLKLHRVAIIIQEELKKERLPVKIPSLDRIKDYLMADPKIKRDFRKIGRFFIL